MRQKLLTFRDIQNEYRRERNTLAKLLMKDAFITPVKIGNKNYFDRNKLEAWIQSKREEQL